MPELSQLWVCTRPSECQQAMSLLCPQQRTHSLRWPLLRIYLWLSLMPCMNMYTYSISYIFHAFVHKKPSKLPACLSIVEWEDMQGLGIIITRIICKQNGCCTKYFHNSPWSHVPTDGRLTSKSIEGLLGHSKCSKTWFFMTHLATTLGKCWFIYI